LPSKEKQMTRRQAELFDLYRAALKSAVDLMKLSLENAERLQNQQLAAVRTALEQQAKTVAELGVVDRGTGPEAEERPPGGKSDR
jgi:hypothetical protein